MSYFELDDIKRRHSDYWDSYNVGGWVTTYDNLALWNVQRCSAIGFIASLVTNKINNVRNCWLELGKYYERPTNFTEARQYIRTILDLEMYKQASKNAMSHSFLNGVFNWGIRLHAFRYVNAGWGTNGMSVNVLHYRNVFCSIVASFATCWVSVPVELAHRAYLADAKWPQHLQRGYTSTLNALVRIPQEEGLYYLFKNSFPIYFGNFFQTVVLLTSYDQLKDKAVNVAVRQGKWPEYPFKFLSMITASYLGAVVAFPWFVTAQRLVDIIPGRTPGKSVWKNNYRNAAYWLWFDDKVAEKFKGFCKVGLWRLFPLHMAILIAGDHLGIFSYRSFYFHSQSGSNTWEDHWI